jgi:hypothetical protein
LAAGLNSLDKNRAKHGARCINRSRVACRTGSDDHELVVTWGHFNVLFNFSMHSANGFADHPCQDRYVKFRLRQRLPWAMARAFRRSLCIRVLLLLQCSITSTNYFKEWD